MIMMIMIVMISNIWKMIINNMILMINDMMKMNDIININDINEIILMW